MINTIAADKIVQDILDGETDGRLVRSITNVKNACKDLISEKVVLNTKTVSEKIKLHYENKPSEKTIRNDNKGIYKKILNAYATCNPRNKETNDNDKKNAEKDELPLNTRIYIAQLEEQVELLTKQVNNFYDEHRKENTLDLTALIHQAPNEHGTIDLPKNQNAINTLQKEAITILTGVHADIEGALINIEGELSKRHAVDSDTGEIALQPHHFVELHKLL